MMDSSDLHTCPLFFWGCGHFFQEALSAVALVGIRVRAMWLRRVTGARGVTWSSPPPASKPGPSQPQPAPSCRSAPFDCPDMEREREGAQCRLLSFVSRQPSAGTGLAIVRTRSYCAPDAQITSCR